MTIIRAAVSPHAISKMNRVFNGTPRDILNELLQNARRAGATLVSVTVAACGQTASVEIADNGHGIGDPTRLVTLGDSHWSAATAALEDPAGMGFFALSGLAARIESSGSGSGFTMTIPADAWTGETDISVEEASVAPGTRISFTMPNASADLIERELSACARHFPVPVECNGTRCQQDDFLDGADRIFDDGSLRIGIFSHGGPLHYPNVNFHGVTLHHKLPSLCETEHRKWSVKVDIVDAPDLTLVLPARKEIFHNAALDALIERIDGCLFAHIAGLPAHSLSYADWSNGKRYVPDLAPAAAELRRWTRTTAEDAHAQTGKLEAIATDGAILETASPRESVTVFRALTTCEHRDRPFYHAKPAFAGYPWYDALAHYTLSAISHLGDIAEPHRNDPNTVRPRTIRLDLHDAKHGQLIRLSTDLAFEDDDSGLDSAEDIPITITPTATIDADELARLIYDAGFTPWEDADADSWDTQSSVYRRDAQVRAALVLHGSDSADAEAVRVWFIDKVSWAIPHDQQCTIVYKNGVASVSLAA